MGKWLGGALKATFKDVALMPYNITTAPFKMPHIDSTMNRIGGSILFNFVAIHGSMIGMAAYGPIGFIPAHIAATNVVALMARVMMRKEEGVGRALYPSISAFADERRALRAQRQLEKEAATNSPEPPAAAPHPTQP